MASIRAMERLRASGHAFNTRGFPALPDEIYLEILSHLPTILVPTEDTIDICNPKSHPNRQLILSSLSQTCQSLRRVFLRYLWQRIEVYEAMDTQKGPLPTFDVLRKKPISNYVHSRYAEEVLRQLETVTIRDPNLAQHVNVLNIVLSYSVETLLPELARCISLFPNLHTVQMHFFAPFGAPALGVATTFEGYKYPQIRNVCLSDNCSGFLASCPRANRVTLYMHIPFCSQLLPCAKEHCPQIERFEYLIFSPTDYDFIMNHFKNLCDVTLYWDLLISYADCIKKSSQPRLCTIRLRPFAKAVDILRPDMLEQCINSAREILLACPKSKTGKTKQIILYHLDGRVDTFPVPGAHIDHT